mmetsp:Transcript_36398/g.120542  ORF Transcript_36398/g.120542 Transcript_36398/m.120542 type:complete len:344 (-) Transcript_36398:299-1330(-)
MRSSMPSMVALTEPCSSSARSLLLEPGVTRHTPLEPPSGMSLFFSCCAQARLRHSRKWRRDSATCASESAGATTRRPPRATSAKRTWKEEKWRPATKKTPYGSCSTCGACCEMGCANSAGSSRSASARRDSASGALVRIVWRRQRPIAWRSERDSSAWKPTATDLSKSSIAAPKAASSIGLVGSKRAAKTSLSAASCGAKAGRSRRESMLLRERSGWSSRASESVASAAVDSARSRPSVGCAAASESAESSSHLKRRRSFASCVLSATAPAGERTMARTSVTPAEGRPGLSDGGSPIMSTRTRSTWSPCMSSVASVPCSARRGLLSPSATVMRVAAPLCEPYS